MAVQVKRLMEYPDLRPLRVDKIAATIAARHRVTWPGQGAFQKDRSRFCMNT
jgi:hypothetical protein